MNSEPNCRFLKTFFAQLSHDEFERIYNNLLEQQFLLKTYGKLTLFEQNSMTAEDRRWWMQRIQEENEKKAEEEKKAMASAPRPSMSSIPRP